MALNLFTDAGLPANDKLIAEYSGKYIATTTAEKFLELYKKFPIDVARGMFAGYLHAYSLLFLNRTDETTEMIQLKQMIHAICRRIHMAQ